MQARVPVQHVHLRPVGGAVEVAHQHRVRVLGQQFGDERQLRQPRLAAQRQVGDGDRQALVAFAEARQQHAAAGNPAGQGVVGHLQRLELAQQAVGAGGHVAHAPVWLVAPVVEAAAFGQVVGLVGEARAPAARVAFLQPDDVVAAGKLDRKSTRLNSSTNAQLVCRLLLEKKNKSPNTIFSPTTPLTQSQDEITIQINLNYTHYVSTQSITRTDIHIHTKTTTHQHYNTSN